MWSLFLYYYFIIARDGIEVFDAWRILWKNYLNIFIVYVCVCVCVLTLFGDGKFYRHFNISGFHEHSVILLEFNVCLIIFRNMYKLRTR